MYRGCHGNTTRLSFSYVLCIRYATKGDRAQRIPERAKFLVRGLLSTVRPWNLAAHPESR
jgi:hypothetical protein